MLQLYLSIYLYTYTYINLCINIYLSVYLYHTNFMNWYLDMPWVPMHAFSTSCDVRYEPPPPGPHAQQIFIYLSIYVIFFSIIYLYIYICIWKLSIYLPYSLINVYDALNREEVKVSMRYEGWPWGVGGLGIKYSSNVQI